MSEQQPPSQPDEGAVPGPPADAWWWSPTPAEAVLSPNAMPSGEAVSPAEAVSSAEAVPSADPGPAPPEPTDVIPGQTTLELDLDVPVPPPAMAVVDVAPPWPGPDPGRRRRRRTSVLALAAAGCLAAGLAGGFAGAYLESRSATSHTVDPGLTLPAPAQVSTARDAASVAGVARRVLPSVVAIRVRGADGAGTGSGFVIDAKGYILTNNHVVSGAAGGGSIKVVFQDGSQSDARVVGRDDSYDLAVVKVDDTGLVPLALGDSDGVVVGDEVIAIGAPLGLQGTVTTGIVSALNRPVAAGESDTPAYINAIQTDAAINPGNSGGPLVDMAGHVIGINSAIARAPGATTTTTGNIGLGFAIPSNQARRTAQQLIHTGKAQHPIIGVLLDRTYDGEGVKVLQTSPSGQPPPVTKGGPADRAGIQPGDVIVAFNGRPVADPDELVVAIRAQTPGATVTLTVRRGTVDKMVRVTLDAAAD